MRMLASTVATHCPYCALQCGMHLLTSDDGVKVAGNVKFPVNEGGLCVKGWSAAATLDHADRLRTPLVRADRGHLIPATCEAALTRIANRFRDVQGRHGSD